MIILTYIIKLIFITQKTDVNTQKFDSLALINFRIVLAGFSVQNKLEKV